MKDDIRRQTCIIIRKNGEYLVGRIFGSMDLRWSNYASDAWRTRNPRIAQEVARKVGGVTILYNAATLEARPLREEQAYGKGQKYE